MKKALTLLLVFLLSLSVFVACDFGQKPEQEQQQGGEVTPPAVEDNLQNAYDYVKLSYKDLKTTANNFEVFKQVTIEDQVFNITWTTNNEAITVTESEDGKFYVVNVPKATPGSVAINYTLSFSVQNKDGGDKKEGSFNLTVPEYRIYGYEEYLNAEAGDYLNVKGIVTGILSKSTNSDKENSIFIQDLNGKGGYYAYQLAEDPVTLGIAVGMTVEVGGYKKVHYGVHELTSPVATIVDETIKEATPLDLTDVFAAASGMDAPELVNTTGTLVSISGVTLLDYDSGNGYHNFQLENNKSYLRVSSSSNCITKDDGKAITEAFEDSFYYSATVTGIVTLYNNNFYLMPVSVDAFSNLQAQTVPADAKVNLALSKIKIPGMIQVAGDTALPTTFAGWTDLSITWEITEGDAATLSGNTLTVATVPTEAKTVALKATFTCGEVTDTKDYTVIVKPISTITIEEANNIGDNMAHNTYTEELYYIVGTVDSVANTQYGNLYIVDGDFTIYVYGTYDSTGKVRYDAMDPQPLKKDTIKVLSTIGKYNNDVQLKNAKVIEHTVHPDNVVNDEPIDDSFVPVRVDTPVLGTAYKFALNQATVGKFVYFNGTTNGFLGTSEKYTEGVDVTIKAVAGQDGAYTISFMDGTTEKFVEIYLNADNKARIRIETTATNYYTYDANLGVYVATFGTKSYYIGTYDTFTTFSASGTNYIANEGNFTAWFYTMVDTSAVSDADKVAAEKNDLTFTDRVEEAVSIDLPAAGKLYEDVLIEWAVATNAVATIVDGKLVVVLPEVDTEDVTVTLTATIKLGDVTETKEFTITVVAPASQPTPIADLIKTDSVAGNYKVAGTVIAVNDKSFLLQDATGAILVYLNTTPSVAVGDTITLEGTTTKYNETWQFDKTGINITKTGTTTVTHPNATVVDSTALDAFVAPINPAYVTVTGVLSVSGNYFNLIVDGATKQGSLTYLAGDLKTAATALNGKKITVTGYTTGISSGKYVNLMVTAVEEAVATDAEKVAIEKNALSIKTNFSSNETLTLPANGTNYTDVAITWTVDGVAATELAIVVGDVAQEIKLVATIKSGEVELTKEFAVKIASSNAIVPKTYTISNYEAGIQYATNEVHELDDNTTVTTDKAHFTTQLRLYSSSTNDSTAVIHSDIAVTSISVNAGNKVDDLAVYVSNDGDKWTQAGTISVTSTSYNDYTLDLGGSYNYIKLDVVGANQIRIASFTLTFAQN